MFSDSQCLMGIKLFSGASPVCVAPLNRGCFQWQKSLCFYLTVKTYLQQRQGSVFSNQTSDDFTRYSHSLVRSVPFNDIRSCSVWLGGKSAGSLWCRNENGRTTANKLLVLLFIKTFELALHRWNIKGGLHIAPHTARNQEVFSKFITINIQPRIS